MTTTAATPAEVLLEHPVAVLVQRLSERLDEVVAGRPVWSMSPDEQLTTLRTLAKVGAQLDALRLQVMVEADRSGAATAAGAVTAADWAAAEVRARRSTARADLSLADMLCRHRHLEAGMLAGRVSLDQAKVVRRALERLPQTGPHAVTCDQVELAERHLVDLCDDFDPQRLEVLGHKIFEVVAPETAERAEAALLAAQEEQALRRTRLRTWRDGEGVTHGRFAVPDLHGDLLRTMIDALASPLRPTPTDGVRAEQEPTEERTPTEQRRGQAFCELLERMSGADLPTTAGGSATLVVTVPVEQLHDDLASLGVVTLATGTPISAGEARRLACAHRLVPAVLGGASEVLDLGRGARLFSRAQRLALHLRDGGCTAEGCDVPAAMCHAHHDLPWSRGGRTDLANARLLCGHHHRRVHDPAFGHELAPDHQVRFHRRV